MGIYGKLFSCVEIIHRSCAWVHLKYVPQRSASVVEEFDHLNGSKSWYFEEEVEEEEQEKDDIKEKEVKRKEREGSEKKRKGKKRRDLIKYQEEALSPLLPFSFGL